MLRNTLGIVNIEGNNVHFGDVMKHRGVQAFGFLGRYRLIDFALSNMSNSGITEFQVYMPAEMRSTIQHVGTGKHYNINSKRGTLRLLNSATDPNSVYRHDINAFTENIHYIENSTKDYVLVAPSYFIYSQDFSKVMDDHIATDADITVLYKNVSDAKENFIGCQTLKFGENHRVVAFEENHGKYKNRPVSLEAYIMKRTTFIDLIKRANKVSSLYWLKDILRDTVDQYKIMGYAHRDYVACINTTASYFNTQIELIDQDTRKLLFKHDWPIHTQTSDSSPCLYGPLAEVKRSLISNGANINGQVENSVIDRDVIIEEGVVIKNSIILNGVTIKSGANIENAIIDKATKIIHPIDIKGSETSPSYLKPHQII
ncbi:glucose-1-phosphate adenylyltransferase subunit GlgD [Streptococcus suis]|uniref:glucose-1-phosphate adenylyltransferase subunit GlgD n=1 Tax=Streptococcus suis TaxID=1307 RepID=UPI000CF460F6|nr:glucose-1-phosphate adenylyltransferase subunit GlgD [Streptococcus suis]MBS8094937.1 glucose-1-phosphate adenylyltransferase subunit GlgD [Streptococcus suis]MBS8103824.1 glucose-1-phosphate adenylyltransferase subunit GlgD [Streptococcus suis]MBY4977191.1 glucose-1-phosphate adenylyltransferase subunit GlgD [Streptococcus suis]MCO8204258.1 glucose-1-phosphate adenylyltransferase subunit GlgD [Streptococcus suis]MCO8204894.1 glucose-1-phosphate adenylyltransferase subunit GlgD [Streptococc